MTLSRRTLLKTSALAAVAGGLGMPHIARAQTPEFVYKYANNLPLTHPMNIRAQEMVQAVAKETEGKVEIKIFPSSQLGGDTDMLSQLRSGGIEFFTLSPLILSTLVPNAAISGIGFAFPDYDVVWKAMDGKLGEYVRGQIAKAGILAMDKIWDNGFRQITTSTKPIETAADLKGLKIRVPVSPLWTSMFKAFESAPASINFAEVYTALQTRTVDAQENPLAIIATAKLYEVQKYCSLTNHMWDGFWFLANRRAFERLPENLRTIVARNINEAGMKQRADVLELNNNLEKELQTKGLAFNKAAPDSFRDQLRKAGFYAEWKGKFGADAWGILESYSGPLS